LLEQGRGFAEGRSRAAEAEDGVFFVERAKRADFRFGLRKVFGRAGRG